MRHHYDAGMLPASCELHPWILSSEERDIACAVLASLVSKHPTCTWKLKWKHPEIVSFRSNQASSRIRQC